MIYGYRADSSFAPSQWEMALLCNNISHWLGASLESSLWLDPCKNTVGILDTSCPSINPSVHLSVHDPSCQLCRICSFGWDFFYHQYKKMCHMWWFFLSWSVIWPQLQKYVTTLHVLSFLLSRIYSSGWILFIFGTDVHYIAPEYLQGYCGMNLFKKHTRMRHTFVEVAP